MRGIVKGVVIGALGLAVLFGSPAVSLAAVKPPPFDPNSCTRESVDRWLCTVDGKVVICTSPDPKGCGSMRLGTPARPQAPVVVPQAPGAIQR